MKLGFIGVGKVGTALAYSFYKKGYSIEAITDINYNQIEKFKKWIPSVKVVDMPEDIPEFCNVIFITTPDDVIESVCTNIAQKVSQHSTVIHTSGLKTTEALKAVSQVGANVLSFHPLQSVSSVENAIEHLTGSTITLEGDNAAIEVGKQFVDDLDGTSIIIEKEQKVLYHCAASIVSNFTVALMDIGMNMLRKLDISTEESRRMLIPLLQGTVSNLQNNNPEIALTGPVERGDIETVIKHLRGLKTEFPEYLKIYKHVTNHISQLAYQKGSISKEKFDNFCKILGN